MNKINIFRIVAEHVATLRDARTDRMSAVDVFTFAVLPLLLGAAGIYEKVKFSYDVLTAILTAFSIFAGLLLNLLLLVFSFVERPQYGTLQGIRKQMLQELHSNISFAILNSIVIVVVAIVCVVRVKMVSPTGVAYTGAVATFLFIFFISNFVLTLLMVLKRMHVLLAQTVKESSLKRSA